MLKATIGKLTSGRLPALEPFESHRFAPDHPLRRLFESSRQRGRHANGADAFSDIIALSRTIRRAHGVERIGEGELRARMARATEWAVETLEQLPNADGIVWFGSSLRGKPAPKDLDVCIVTSGERVEWHDAVTGLCRCQRLQSELSSLSSGPGLPAVSAKAIAWYDEHPFLRLRFVERCPYLALARGRSKQLCGFSNVGGEEYLEVKAP